MKTLEEYPYLETLLRESLKKLDEKKLIVVDIGAFDGMNCILLKRGFRNIMIYAIEPCPTNYKMLRKKVKKHKNIIPCRIAISNSIGRENLYICRVGGAISSQSNSLFMSFIESKGMKKDWRI